MRPEEVALYLKEHPEFFEQHAELVGSLRIPHPEGGRAIPLVERQVLTLREKGRLLEGKLRELVQFGEDNDAIGDRVHRITLALLAARDLPALVQSLYNNLRDDFGVPAVALRLWSESAAQPLPEFEPVSQEAKVFADSLTAPYVCDHAMFESADWFTAGARPLRAFAYVSLRAERACGVLALASDDAQRFTPDMGTLYLTRLGELVSMALKRYLEP